MKIGIITHHYVKNYGAFLQAKGLYETLKKNYPDAKVEIINYVHFKHWLMNILHVLHFRKGIDTFSSYIKKIKQLFMFSRYEHSIPRSKRVYTAQDINNLHYDLIVFGSDEIWDRLGRGFSSLKYGVGLDHAAKRMIAYAPSVGKVNGEDELCYELQSGLRNFDALSARDIQTQKMIKQIGVDAPIVLDPTFLYDFTKDIVDEKIKKPPYNYILIYDCKLNESQINVLVKYALENNLEIIGGGDKKDYYTKETILLTPFEWVSLFANASMVITGTFHGTVFSIKYNKNVICYPTEKNRIQKISSLLTIFNMKERLLASSNSIDFEKMIKLPVDYTEPNKIISRMKDESFKYLKISE